MKLLFIVLIIVTNICVAQSELEYNLDSVVVSTNRVPLNFSEFGRTINLLSQRDIELLPSTNVYDLLDQISGVDIKQRGPEGVQADVSIRGGNFEQTLILIDGVKLIDPQTGHHNMNLPVALSQIERVEILKGQGTKSYGANAFSGAINLITKKSGNDKIGFELSGGENNFYTLGLNSSLNIGNTFHNFSFSKSKSDGYRLNTGFENYLLSVDNSFKFSNIVLNTIYGFSDKDFGANSFYSIRFPNQAEKTKTHFASVTSDINFNSFIVKPKIRWRTNSDEFVLNKFNPSFYKNNHETTVYGGELEISTNLIGGTTSFGTDYDFDKIQSSNLGNHKRTKLSFFIEQNSNLTNNFKIGIGGFLYKYTNTNWNFWPGIDIAYNLIDKIKIFANYGKAFRIPSYTELYYSDPANLGNENLLPEESSNYELGINYFSKSLLLHFSYFRKEGKNLIDYVYDNSDSIWKAQNFTKINTNGLEVSIDFLMGDFLGFLEKTKIDYTYLKSDKIDLGELSKYTLDFLNHDLTISILHKLPFEVEQSWSLNYEDRIILDNHFTIDTKITKKINNILFFVNVSNVLNKSYQEIPGIPLPGRWIIGGIKFNIL
ncbi:MAG: TonB-dependent receptor [Ignavibacteriales bacterium]|nr:TonB-dependent receptor [Ignavibacteriales bacterium]